MKTPLPLVNACSQFIYTENLQNGSEIENVVEIRNKSRNELRGDCALVKLLRISVEQTSEEDGWSDLSKVGKYNSNNSSFSSINYGFKNLAN